jgi:hypothetical protein
MTFLALRDLHAIPTVPAVDVKALVRQACEEWLEDHPGKTLVDFAAEADVPYTGGLMRWRGVGNGPDAENLVKVISAAGMFSTHPFSKALTLAAELVRRLEAGERLQPERLVRVAEATEEAGQAALLFADRLRREAEAHG